MLRDALFIARKDLHYTMRSREAILWIFLMPIVFFYFIGTITAGFRGGNGEGDVLAVKEGVGAGFMADQLLRRLEDRGFDVVIPEQGEDLSDYPRLLTIPDAFTDSVLAGNPVTLEFLHKEEGLSNDDDLIRAKRAAYTVLADLTVTSIMGSAPSPGSFEELDAMPRALELYVRPAGKRKEIPGGFEQAIPGIMVMFTLLLMTTSGAVLLVIERRQGLLRRLACTPIGRSDVVMGKWGGKMAVGIVQISFAMLTGTVLFGMDWGPDLGMILLVMILYAASMASLGIILGSVAQTEGQAVAVGVISSNVLAALGGCWWPIEITPQWMQRLQLFLPTGWAMDALHRLISFSSGPASIVPHLLGMSLAAFISIAVAVKVFRYE